MNRALKVAWIGFAGTVVAALVLVLLGRSPIHIENNNEFPKVVIDIGGWLHGTATTAPTTSPPATAAPVDSGDTALAQKVADLEATVAALQSQPTSPPATLHIVVPTLTTAPKKEIPTIDLAPDTYAFSNRTQVYYNRVSDMWPATTVDAVLESIEVRESGELVANARWENTTDGGIYDNTAVTCANRDDDDEVHIDLPDGSVHYALDTSCTTQRGLSVTIERGERWGRSAGCVGNLV